MKQLMTLLFGDLGLFLVSGASSIASWFLFPLFVSVLNATNVFSSIIGWLLVCPFALGFYISSLFSALSLIWRSAEKKSWLWLCAGILLFAVDVVIVVKSLI